MPKFLNPEQIFSLVHSSGMHLQKAAEIGVYSYETSAVRPLIESHVRCDLYEAVPKFSQLIEQKLVRFQNTKLFNFAVSDYDGEMQLCMVGPSTFNAIQQQSPAINHDGVLVEKMETLSVTCRDFAALDPGDYDFISIDVEGGEYRILSRMKSRPLVINIETQSRDYINPKLGSITDWMYENGYKVWFRNDTDTLFLKGIPISKGILFDLSRWWHNKKYFAGRL